MYTYFPLLNQTISFPFSVLLLFLEFLFVFSRFYSNCTGPGFTLHSEIVMPYITHFGSKEQIDKYIPRMMTGECISCIAMTEPGAGR